MGLNAWLLDRSLLARSAIGAVLVAAVSFALNYSGGPTGAAITAAIVGPAVGCSYYLGMRARTAVGD